MTPKAVAVNAIQKTGKMRIIRLKPKRTTPARPSSLTGLISSQRDNETGDDEEHVNTRVQETLDGVGDILRDSHFEPRRHQMTADNGKRRDASHRLNARKGTHVPDRQAGTVVPPQPAANMPTPAFSHKPTSGRLSLEHCNDEYSGR